MQKIHKLAHAAKVVALCLPPVIMSLIGLAALQRQKGGRIVARNKPPPPPLDVPVATSIAEAPTVTREGSSAPPTCGKAGHGSQTGVRRSPRTV
jgi:hypothetical protein